MAISGALKLLNPKFGENYDVEIMVKNSLDRKYSYKEIKSQKLTADKNKEWIRIETDYIIKEGDAQAYFQVFMIKIYII